MPRISSSAAALYLEELALSPKSQLRQLCDNFGPRPSPAPTASCDPANSNRRITKPTTSAPVESEAIKVALSIKAPFSDSTTWRGATRNAGRQMWQLASSRRN
jgi:hypothetical protein